MSQSRNGDPQAAPPQDTLSQVIQETLAAQLFEILQLRAQIKDLQQALIHKLTKEARDADPPE